MRGQNGTPDPCLISLDTFSKPPKEKPRPPLLKALELSCSDCLGPLSEKSLARLLARNIDAHAHPPVYLSAQAAFLRLASVPESPLASMATFARVSQHNSLFCLVDGTPCGGASKHKGLCSSAAEQPFHTRRVGCSNQPIGTMLM